MFVYITNLQKTSYYIYKHVSLKMIQKAFFSYQDRFKRKDWAISLKGRGQEYSFN